MVNSSCIDRLLYLRGETTDADETEPIARSSRFACKEEYLKKSSSDSPCSLRDADDGQGLRPIAIGTETGFCIMFVSAVYCILICF